MAINIPTGGHSGSGSLQSADARGSSGGRRVFTGAPSQKIGAVALAGAISTILWTLMVAYVATDLSKEVIATLTGATTTIFAFGLGYVIRG
jgi:hypothetical protein